MTYETIISSIKKREFNPVYFLEGEEHYFIDEITALLEKTVLSEDEKAFNQIILYGKDVSVEEVVSASKRYPMMAPYQVVLVKEAQHINKIEGLEDYLNNPMPTTILVICYKGKTVDKRKALAKKLSKSFVHFTAKKMYENQVTKWIEGRLKAEGYTISPKATVMLVEYLGTSLSKLDNELSKLQLILPQGTRIEDIHIQDNIGISKDYNVFELLKSLGCKDFAKTMMIVSYFVANPKDNPLVMIIPQLYSYFTKLLRLHYLMKSNNNDSELARIIGVNPYFFKEYRDAMRYYNIRQVVDAITLLREYDMKSKGGSVSFSDGELLKELILKIMYK